MSPAIRRLSAWYRTHQRRLPWRNAVRPNGTPDAYRIFISEVMLQQTQVDRVIPKYRAWLKQFPTWQKLAGAKTDALIRAWAGLGYNRRALNLREAAQHVCTFGEPRNETEWRMLKGVGPYTAAALSVFANHKPAIVIDTNVRRVAGRIFLGKPFPELKDDARLKKLLESHGQVRGRFWDVPQAFMDLGSAVCTSRSPQCAVCPLKNVCKSSATFLNGAPVRRKKSGVQESRHRNKKFPNRIYRGRMLAAVRQTGPSSLKRIGSTIDETYEPAHDLEWIRRLASGLVKDGLLRYHHKDMISLP